MTTIKHIEVNRTLPTSQLVDGMRIYADGARIELKVRGGMNSAYTVYLVEPGAILQIVATGILQGDDRAMLDITVVHEAPHTKAETIILTVLKEHSHVNIKGLLRILPGSNASESFFNHHSLVFDAATVETWPALEINNNEVRCSHAATVKTITPEDLFYSQSRGIPEEKVKEMMINAFIQIDA